MILKRCGQSGGNKVKLDLPNYATKDDLKIETNVDTSNLASESNLD